MRWVYKSAGGGVICAHDAMRGYKSIQICSEIAEMKTKSSRDRNLIENV